MNVTLGMHISYKKYPVTPVFEYCEDTELTQQLIKDPTSVMKRKTTRRLFWLKLLIHGVFKGGQFIFDTIIPPCTKNQQNTVAARTLFQLDGDMLVIIDKNILARTDGIDIIGAHSSWSNWCLEQLKVTSVKRIRFLRLLLRLLRFRFIIWSVGEFILRSLVRSGRYGIRRKIQQYL